MSQLNDIAASVSVVLPNPNMPVRHDTLAGPHYHVPGDPLMDSGDPCPYYCRVIEDAR